MSIFRILRAKEVIWVGLGQVAQFFGGLIFLKAVTSHLTPFEFGTFTIFLTISTLVQTVILGGIQGAVTRYYSVSKSEEDLPAFAGSIAVIGSVLASIILVIGTIASSGFHWSAQQEIGHAALALTLLSMLMIFSGLINAIDTGARRQGLVSLHSAGNLWLRAGAILLIVPLISEGHVGALWSVTLATAGILLSQTLFVLRNERVLLDAKSLRRWSGAILVFALPYMSWGAITWGQQVADRWLLKIFADAQAVGEYVALAQLAYSPVLLISAAVQRLVTPILYDLIGDGTEAQHVRQAVKFQIQMIAGLFGIGFGLSLLAAIGHEKFTGLVLGPNFQDKSYLLPYFILAATLMSSYHLSGAIIPAIFQAKKMVLPLGGLSLISIVIMAAGAYFGAVVGITFGLLISGFFFFASVSLLARRLVIQHLQALK